MLRFPFALVWTVLVITGLLVGCEKNREESSDIREPPDDSQGPGTDEEDTPLGPMTSVPGSSAGGPVTLPTSDATSGPTQPPACTPACGLCTCPNGEMCVSGEGCRAPAEIGAACDYDEQCKSRNCSSATRVCRTAVGQPCTEANCDRCVQYRDGSSYCSRVCNVLTALKTTTSCGALSCISFSGSENYTCVPKCTGDSDKSCPGRCTYVPGTFENVCDCAGACTVVRAKSSFGQGCDTDDQCESGDCGQSGFLSLNGNFGYCTKACQSDGDCPSAAACVDVPCLDQDKECGRRCLVKCEATPLGCLAGTCADRTSTSGAMLKVCDLKKSQGLTCSRNDECRSGSCIAGMCAEAGGIANGSRCTKPADCRAGSCVSGLCRGAALIGDACAMEYDCAVGACCSGTCCSR